MEGTTVSDNAKSRSVLNLSSLQALPLAAHHQDETNPLVAVKANFRELEWSGDLPLGENQIFLLLELPVARTLLEELQDSLKRIDEDDYIDPLERPQ